MQKFKKSFFSFGNQLMLLLWPLYLLSDVSSNLGVESVGQFFIIVTSVSFSMGVCEFGANLSGVKILSRKKNMDSLVHSIIFARIPICILMAIFLLAYLIFVAELGIQVVFFLILFILSSVLNVEFIAIYKKNYITMLIIRILSIITCFVFYTLLEMNSAAAAGLIYMVSIFLPRVFFSKYSFDFILNRHQSKRKVLYCFRSLYSGFVINVNSLLINAGFFAFAAMFCSPQVIALNAIFSKLKIPSQFIISSLSPLVMVSILNETVDAKKIRLVYGSLLFFFGIIIFIFGNNYGFQILTIIFGDKVVLDKDLLLIYLMLFLPVVFSQIFGLMGIFLLKDSSYRAALYLSLATLYITFLVMDKELSYTIPLSMFFSECVLALTSIFLFFKYKRGIVHD